MKTASTPEKSTSGRSNLIFEEPCLLMLGARFSLGRKTPPEMTGQLALAASRKGPQPAVFIATAVRYVAIDLLHLLAATSNQQVSEPP